MNVEPVKKAVQNEIDGWGKLLRYRAMTLKLRTEHDIYVLTHVVRKVMQDIDPDRLDVRSVTKKISAVFVRNRTATSPFEGR